MQTYVLVTYASKHGATQEIAEKIGQVLNASGIVTDVEAIEQVRDLTPYTAVVVGSAVYAGQWMHDAVGFLKAHQFELAQRPSWFFSSGPTGEGDPVQLTKGWRFPEGQMSLSDQIRPRDMMLFHGDINTSKLNLAEKLIIKGVKAPTGDFRDWSVITAWAIRIAETLTTIKA